MNEHQTIASRRIFVLRLTAALMTIVFAFVLTYILAWSRMQYTIFVGRAGYSVPGMLRHIGSELADFAAKNGRYPQSVKELYECTTLEKRFGPLGESGELPFFDFWNNRFHYQTTGRNYRIYTVRRDGTVGSVELTGDLDRDREGTVRYEPSVHEFLCESKHSLALFWATLLSSVAAGVLCFVLIPLPGTPAAQLGCLTGALFFLTLPAFFVFTSALSEPLFGAGGAFVALLAVIAYMLLAKRLFACGFSLTTTALWILLVTVSAVAVSLCIVMACMILE